MTKELNYQEAIEKLIKISDLLDKKQDELSPEMADIITALTKKHEDDNWENFFEMFEDMSMHALANGGAIIQEDRPRQLRLGYRCTNTGKTWSIRISAVKCSATKQKESGNMQRVDILQQAMQTQLGKENLLNWINGK